MWTARRSAAGLCAADRPVVVVVVVRDVACNVQMSKSAFTHDDRYDDRFANRSSCVNSQIHCFQTGRHTGRKNQTCLILATRQTTGAMCVRSCDRYDDRFANLCKVSGRSLADCISMVLTARVDFTKYYYYYYYYYLFNDYYLLFIIYLFLYYLFIYHLFIIYLIFIYYLLFLYYLFTYYLLIIYYLFIYHLFFICLLFI